MYVYVYGKQEALGAFLRGDPHTALFLLGVVMIAVLPRQALGSQKQKFQGQFRLSEPGWRRLQAKSFTHKAGLEDAWTSAKATSRGHDFIPLRSLSSRARRAISTQRLETREYESRQWERPGVCFPSSDFSRG